MSALAISKIIKYISSPDYRFVINAHKGLYDSMSDEEYLKRLFKSILGYPLDLEHPKTFNEKLQWLKIHDRQPVYTTLVDKYLVKDYIASIIGNQYIIPTIGVWDRFDDIDFRSLPKQFVLKCTHDSGGLVIVHDKKKMDIDKIKTKIIKSLNTDYYLQGREWPYKEVKKRIIAEQYMSIHEHNQSNMQEELLDYKLLCFNGKVRCSFVCSDRYSPSGLKVTFFDEDWNVMPFERHYPKANYSISKPQNYEKMVELAEKICINIPFARIDFYEVDNKVYFGEVTLYPGNGFEEFTPRGWDDILGGWIDLSMVNIYKKKEDICDECYGQD